MMKSEFRGAMARGAGFAAGMALFVAGAAFAAAAWGSLPTVSGGNQVSSSAWNDIVGQLNSIAGAVSVDGTHLATTLPTANNHVATKAYVDAAGGGGTSYLGMTTLTHKGDMGGITGANAKCQADFAGSHMCSIREIAESGQSTNLAAYGWVRFESSQVYGTTYYFDGIGMNGSLPTNTIDCYGWTSQSNGYYGTVLSTTASLSASACGSASKIHCCK